MRNQKCIQNLPECEIKQLKAVKNVKLKMIIDYSQSLSAVTNVI